jgi:hypothetical protein
VSVAQLDGARPGTRFLAGREHVVEQLSANVLTRPARDVKEISLDGGIAQSFLEITGLVDRGHAIGADADEACALSIFAA